MKFLLFPFPPLICFSTPSFPIFGQAIAKHGTYIRWYFIKLCARTNDCPRRRIKFFDTTTTFHNIEKAEICLKNLTRNYNK